MGKFTILENFPRNRFPLHSSEGNIQNHFTYCIPGYGKDGVDCSTSNYRENVNGTKLMGNTIQELVKRIDKTNSTSIIYIASLYVKYDSKSPMIISLAAALQRGAQLFIFLDVDKNTSWTGWDQLLYLQNLGAIVMPMAWNHFMFDPIQKYDFMQTGPNDPTPRQYKCSGQNDNQGNYCNTAACYPWNNCDHYGFFHSKLLLIRSAEITDCVYIGSMNLAQDKDKEVGILVDSDDLAEQTAYIANMYTLCWLIQQELKLGWWRDGQCLTLSSCDNDPPILTQDDDGNVYSDTINAIIPQVYGQTGGVRFLPGGDVSPWNTWDDVSQYIVSSPYYRKYFPMFGNGFGDKKGIVIEDLESVQNSQYFGCPITSQPWNNPIGSVTSMNMSKGVVDKNVKMTLGVGPVQFTAYKNFSSDQQLLISCIQNAEREICIQQMDIGFGNSDSSTYNWEGGDYRIQGFWAVFHDALTQAVQRGVIIRLLLSYNNSLPPEDQGNFPVGPSQSDRFNDFVKAVNSQPGCKGALLVKIMAFNNKPCDIWGDKDDPNTCILDGDDRNVGKHGIFHCKWLMADDKIYFGEQNFTPVYYVLGAGISLVVENSPSIKNFLYNIFNRDWASDYAYDMQPEWSSCSDSNVTSDFKEGAYYSRAVGAFERPYGMKYQDKDQKTLYRCFGNTEPGRGNCCYPSDSSVENYQNFNFSSSSSSLKIGIILITIGLFFFIPLVFVPSKKKYYVLAVIILLLASGVFFLTRKKEIRKPSPPSPPPPSPPSPPPPSPSPSFKQVIIPSDPYKDDHLMGQHEILQATYPALGGIQLEESCQYLVDLTNDKGKTYIINHLSDPDIEQANNNFCQDNWEDNKDRIKSILFRFWKAEIFTGVDQTPAVDPEKWCGGSSCSEDQLEDVNVACPALTSDWVPRICRNWNPSLIFPKADDFLKACAAFTQYYDLGFKPINYWVDFTSKFIPAVQDGNLEQQDKIFQSYLFCLASQGLFRWNGARFYTVKDGKTQFKVRNKTPVDYYSKYTNDFGTFRGYYDTMGPILENADACSNSHLYLRQKDINKRMLAWCKLNGMPASLAIGTAAELDSALERMPLNPLDLVLWKGMENDPCYVNYYGRYADLKPGDLFTIDGYISTTLNPGVSQHYTCGGRFDNQALASLDGSWSKNYPDLKGANFCAIFKINLPKGTSKCHYKHDSSNYVWQLILPRQSQFKLDNINPAVPFYTQDQNGNQTLVGKYIVLECTATGKIHGTKLDFSDQDVFPIEIPPWLDSDPFSVKDWRFRNVPEWVQRLYQLYTEFVHSDPPIFPTPVMSMASDDCHKTTKGTLQTAHGSTDSDTKSNAWQNMGYTSHPFIKGGLHWGSFQGYLRLIDRASRALCTRKLPSDNCNGDQCNPLVLFPDNNFSNPLCLPLIPQRTKQEIVVFNTNEQYLRAEEAVTNHNVANDWGDVGYMAEGMTLNYKSSDDYNKAWLYHTKVLMSLPFGGYMTCNHGGATSGSSPNAVGPHRCVPGAATTKLNITDEWYNSTDEKVLPGELTKNRHYEGASFMLVGKGPADIFIDYINENKNPIWYSFPADCFVPWEQRHLLGTWVNGNKRLSWTVEPYQNQDNPGGNFYTPLGNLMNRQNNPFSNQCSIFQGATSNCPQECGTNCYGNSNCKFCFRDLTPQQLENNASVINDQSNFKPTNFTQLPTVP